MTLQRALLTTANSKQLQAFVSNEQYVASAGLEQYISVYGKHMSGGSFTLFYDLDSPVIIETVYFRWQKTGIADFVQQSLVAYLPNTNIRREWIEPSIEGDFSKLVIRPNLLWLPGERLECETYPSDGTVSINNASYEFTCRKVWAELVVPRETGDL